MKKTLFMVAVVVAFVAASCGNKTNTYGATEVVEDSTVVEEVVPVDSLAVDSTVTDSVVEAEAPAVAE